MAEDGKSTTIAEDGKVAEDGEESLSKKPRLSPRKNVVMDNDIWNPCGLEVVYEYGTDPPRSPEPRIPDRGHRPRERSCHTFLGLLPPDECGEYVEMALSKFNDSNRAQKGPEYELVEVLGCTAHRIMGVFHFNIIGRPQNATPNKLFFGEVSYAVGKDGTGGGLICSCCCILGPPGTVTGLGGCELYCENKLGLIQHPEGGGFTKKLKLYLYPRHNTRLFHLVSSEMRIKSGMTTTKMIMGSNIANQRLHLSDVS